MKRYVSQPQSHHQAPVNTSSASADTDTGIPDFTAVTAQGILRLQRLVGNQAVQRLIQTRRIGLRSSPAKPVIQREAVETGLRQDDLTETFVGDVHAFCSAPENAGKSVNAFIRILKREVNQALKVIGVPSVDVVEEEGSGFGSFQPQTWSIGFSRKETVGDARTIRELSQENLLESLKTMYHEARHAEQLFRIARMLAGEQLTPDARPSQRSKVADKLVERLNIQPNIARKATLDPLYESVAGGTAEFKEAQKWWEGFSSPYRKYPEYLRQMRDTTLHKLIDDPLRNLVGDAEEGIKGKVPENYESLPDEAKQQIDRQAKPDLDYIEICLDELTAIWGTQFMAACNRIRKIDPAQQTDEDRFMLQHLQLIVAGIQQIETMRPIETGEVIELRSMLAQTIEDETLAIIQNFPHEQDAWDMDDIVEEQFKQLQ
jgi:hypothetical protein